MKDRTSIFSRIAAGARRRLRAAAICLLGVAASASISASVPSLAAPAAAPMRLAPTTGAALLIVATPAIRSDESAQTWLRSGRHPLKAARPRFSRRFFVQNTSHSPGKAPQGQAGRVLISYASLLPQSPALGSRSISGSNRQRAP